MKSHAKMFLTASLVVLMISMVSMDISMGDGVTMTDPVGIESFAEGATDPVVMTLPMVIVPNALEMDASCSPCSSWDFFEYRTINGDTEVEITDYTGPGGDVVIPSEIDGKPVTSIGDHAFFDCTSITSVSLPEGVTAIGEGAFFDCTSILSINIPCSVTIIGYEAFTYCEGMTSITVDASNPSYSSLDGVLYNKSMAELISFPAGKVGAFVVPDGVTTIGGRAFCVSDSLTSVTIPDSVTTIGELAFEQCASLTSIIIPQSVTTIDFGAFSGCTSLTSVTIPDSVTTIYGDMFSGCTSLTSINIPDVVTTVGDEAFFGCTSLTSITIPDDVTSIGMGAFAYCDGLTSITFYGDAPSVGANWAFDHNDSLTVFFYDGCTGFATPTWQGIPSTCIYASDYLEYDLINGDTEVRITGYKGSGGPVFIPSVIEGKPVTTIGDWAFANCTSLTSITIASNVKTIGEFAFYECTSLTSITIPDGVTTIGRAAFYECRSLASVTIPDDVTTIQEYSFNRCTSLTSITIPDGVTTIGDSAFEFSVCLTSVTIPDSVTTIGNSTFYHCTSLTSITIPENVTTIGDSALVYCESMTCIEVDVSNPSYSSLDGVLYNKFMVELITFPAGKAGPFTIPDSVTIVGEYSFNHCESLTSVTIPDGVTSIGDHAFSYCESLTSVTIPDGVTSIEYGTFFHSTSLTSITIGEGVTTIKTEAFYECRSLTSVTIPDGVTSIGDFAFTYCYALTSITFNGDAPTMGTGWASGHNDSFVVYFHDGSTGFTTPSWEGVPSFCLSVPGVVDDVATVYVTGRIEVTWSAPSDGNSTITHYLVQRNGTDPITTEDTWYNDTTVVDGYAYTYNVTAINVIGSGPTSSDVDTFTVPSVPRAVSSTEGVGYVNVTWSTPDLDGGTAVTGYVIYRDDGASFTTTSLWYNDTTVVAGNEYVYTVRAANDIGQGPLTIELDGNTVPAAPVSFESHGVGWANVTWAAPADGGSDIVEYIVERDDSSQWIVTTLWFNDTTVEAGVQYTYGVTAVNGVGEGASSLISIGDLEYEITGGGTEVRIIGYTGHGGDVIIPSTIVGLPVTTIGGSAFASQSSITSVTITENVTVIGDRSFRFCSSLTSITIGEDVTTIGYLAFEYCTSLSSVTIPENVTIIEERAFFFCHGLGSIDVVANNLAYASEDGVLYDRAMTTLIQCPGALTGEFIIPSGVTTLGAYSFGGCKCVTSVIIDDDVTTIGKWAFVACANLTYVNIPDGVVSIGDGTFESCISLVSIIIPDGVQRIGDRTFEYCFSLASIEIGEGVTAIGDYAFASCTSLESIDLPDDLTSFGEGCFQYCESITSIDVPCGVTVMADYAFFNCSALASVTMGDEVTTIGHWAFCMCPSLASILLPDSVRTIEGKAFAGCESLTTIVIPVNVSTIGDYAFIRCLSLTSIDVDERNDAYSSVDGILYDGSIETLIQCPAGRVGVVEVPGTVRTIGPWAFEFCALVTSVTMPEGVTTIGWGAFEYCLSLTSFTVPSNVTSIEERAFRGCSALTAITFDGDAPIMGLNWAQDHNESLTVYHLNGTTGFTTPTWQGLPSVCMSAPDAPVDMTTDCHYNHVNVTWSEPFDGNSTIVHYAVYRNGTFISNVTGTWYVDVNVTECEWYSYSVSAVNVVGEGPVSTVDVQVPDETAPDIEISSPSEGAVLASFEIVVVWTANDTGSGIAGFDVSVDDDALVGYNATTTSTALTLDEGPHTIVVTAYDVAGNHANSTVNFIIAIKPIVTDHSPTGINVSKEASIVITFSEPMDHDSVTVTCGSVALTASWDGNAVTLTHDAFDANTRYDVVVNGNDSHGNAMEPFTWSFTTENVVTITGVVSNGDGPVVNAMVTLDSGETTTTDSEGRYTLTTTLGEHTITVTKDGFDTVTDTVTVTTSAVQTFDETLLPTTSSMILWLGVIVALVVVAAIAFVVYRRR